MNPSLQFPLTAIECAGCQTCSFQRGHDIGYKDANGRWVRVNDLVPMVEQYENSKKEASELFSAVQREIKEEVERALGYAQHCTAQQAVRRLAQHLLVFKIKTRRMDKALHIVNRTLGDMHDNSPACLFNGAKGEDVGCLACVAQMQIEEGLKRQ